MAANELNETKISEQVAAGVDCIEFRNNDSTLKAGSSTVENGDVLVHCSAIYESNEGYIGKSTCSLTVHETSLPKSETTTEGDIFSGKDDGRTGGNVSESCVTECLQSADGGNTEYKEEKHLNLRPRRKSKYLSPPFIQPVKGELSKGSSDKSTQESGKPSLVKHGKKRKQPMKPTAVSAKLEEIKASSAELILQLNAAASDYLMPYNNKAFESAKLFFTSFRASSFPGVSIEEQTRVDKTYAQKKVRTLKQKKAPSSLCDGKPKVASSSPMKVDPLSSNIKPQRKRKRKVEPTANSESEKNQTTQIPDLNCVSGVPKATFNPLQVIWQGEDKSVNGVPSATLDPLQVTGQGEVRSVIGLPSATVNALHVTGKGEVKSVNGLPSATLNPLHVTGQGEVKSVSGLPSATTPVPLHVIGQGEVKSVSGLSSATLDPLHVTGQGEVKSFSGLPSAALDPLNVTGQGEVNSVNGVPSSTFDPLRVTGQGEAQSVPEKKKKIRKNKTPSFPSGAKSISLEERLKNAFGATTVPTANIASSPGFLDAFGASTVPNSGVASPPGFLAKGSTPSTPILPPKLEPNNAAKSSSGMSLDQMKQSLEFMTSMLEKSGDMISPEMRVNLEKEIKNLLKKVDPMIGSSS